LFDVRRFDVDLHDVFSFPLFIWFFIR